MQQQIGNGCISFFIRIVILHPFGYQIIQFDCIAADEIHQTKSRGNHTGDLVDIIQTVIANLHIVQLIRVGEKSEILSIYDLGLVSHD
jgi:hypothetical protein